MRQPTTTASPSVVEKICNLPQWRVCNLNPRNGRSFEKIVKKSIEQSLVRQGIIGTVRLNSEREKRRLPDIFLDVAGRRISCDCRYWTRTESRNGRIYLSREFYGSTRFEPSIISHVQDGDRFHFVGWSLSVTGTKGHNRRLLFLVPGKWILDQFKNRPGIRIDTIAETWPGYQKNRELLYDIDILKLIQTADSYPAEVV